LSDVVIKDSTLPMVRPVLCRLWIRHYCLLLDEIQVN
jgi:hypothetical protein